MMVRDFFSKLLRREISSFVRISVTVAPLYPGRLEGAIAEEAVPFPCAARRSFVLRCVCVVVPAHAQLDGESASCSPGHRAMCWSPLGARAAAAQHRISQ